MYKKDWHKYAFVLKDVLGLESSPVAIKFTEKPQKLPTQKARICRALLDASQGKTISICKENNKCFGAAQHLGFNNIYNPEISEITKKFVVQGEKLFSSIETLDKLISQIEKPRDNSKKCFLLSPMDAIEQEPDLIVFVCNSEVACRLLALAVFKDGVMPEIKIGGSTCSMAIMYPLVSGQVNISFFDYTSRNLCNVDKSLLLVSIPYKRNIPQIIENIDKCTAGKAKFELPKSFIKLAKKDKLKYL